jgi:hypothetical protein
MDSRKRHLKMNSSTQIGPELDPKSPKMRSKRRAKNSENPKARRMRMHYSPRDSKDCAAHAGVPAPTPNPIR